jgi:hypothetical protein
MRIAGTYNDYKHNSSVKTNIFLLNLVYLQLQSGTKWHMAQHSNFLFQFVAGILEQILLILSLASSIPYPHLYVQKILSHSTISRLK